MALRRSRLLAVLGAALFWGSLGVPHRALAQDEPIPQPEGDMDVTTFDETLSPYGQWVDTGEGPNDGRAWRPDPDVVGEDFQPYATGGHWVYSDYGWTWESDYPWGWAPFHYGRWALTPSWGWVWYPGAVLAPAWVDWRFGGGYIGWAPLPPVGYAVVVQPWRPYWCFVPSNVFIYRDVWAYRLPVGSIHAAYAATVPVHQAVSYGRARWYAGPPVPQVEHAVGRPVPRVTGFTPPPPGRVQPVLPPSRGLAPGAIAPRPGQPFPGVSSPRPATPGGSTSPGWRAPSSPSSPWRGAPPPGGGTPTPRSPTPSAPSGPSAPGPRPRSLGYWSPQPRSDMPSTPGPRTFAAPSSPRSYGAPRTFSTPSPGGYGGAPRSFSAPSSGGFGGAPHVSGGYSAPHGGGGGGHVSSGGGGGHASSGGGGHSGGGGGRR
ncbi:MAG TPA: DUF6600 domain-containing protein [Myxococcaceae bacterium]|nr:DUF6600 domain-containing protein [Myxococcaceae bacterium]